MQVDIAADGTVSIVPLPPPRATATTASPLDADTARLAAEQYRSLWPGARAAVAHLLIAGDATEQELGAAIGPRGYSDGSGNLLARIASATQLVQRFEAADSKATILLGYRGRYTINPRFRAALERLVSEDTELRR
jgi:hypothetical protein